MRKPKTIILIIFLLSLFGCGGETRNADAPKTESAEKISVRFEEKEISFEPTYAKFATFKKGLILNDSAIQNKNERVEATVHRIYLANYDLRLTDPSKQDYTRINSDGQYRVEIQIEAEKDAAENASLKIKNYQTKTEPFDRVSSVVISRFDDGKDSNSILGGSKASGTVKIISVTDAEISGEIDFSDSDGTVKGKFTAKKL
jgi:hypothetical protein